ncbi:MAG: zinc ribbon domain-containing protein [Clostridiales bacterium]|nr:zinc ribbon domain-containing protein [Clostridiales bacterium]
MSKCQFCGSEIEDGAKFCSNCGATAPVAAEPAAVPAPVVAEPVVPQPEPQPIAQPAPQPQYQQPQPVYSAPASNNNYSTFTEQPKNNGCCVAGFVVSLVSLLCCGLTAIISLILSIIGLATVGKKKQKGKGLAVAGLIISIVQCIFFIFFFLIGNAGMIASMEKYISSAQRVTRSSSSYDDDDEDDDDWDVDDDDEDDDDDYDFDDDDFDYTTDATDSTTESTSGGYSGSLSVLGSTENGYIDLTQGAWDPWTEATTWPDSVVKVDQAFNSNSGAIITMVTYNTDQDADTMARTSMAHMDSQGVSGITGAHVTIGGYNASQAYGLYPDGTYFVCWYFRTDEDDYLHYIAVEFPESDYASFSMVENNFRMN